MKISVDHLHISAAYEGEGDEYAFYLYVDGEFCDRTPYSTSRSVAFDVPDAGLLQIKVFARDRNGGQFREWSPAVTLTTAKVDYTARINERAMDIDSRDEEDRASRRASYDQMSAEDVAHVFLAAKNQAAPKPSGWFVINRNFETAHEILSRGWVFESFDPVDPHNLKDWGQVGRKNRSWGFHLNAWEFMDPVLHEFEDTRDRGLLRWMQEVAENWWDYALREPDDSAMLWYDMALSLRAPRLVRLALAISREFTDFDHSMWLQMLARHQSELFEGRAFNPNNNHGFFTAAASIDMARNLPMMPHMSELETAGQERMAIMVDRQFGADGGHLEHSPDYHRMLLSSFESALSDGLILDESTKTKIRMASYVYGWMIQPDGKQVQLGDSPSFDVGENELHSVDERAEFILTDGERGTPDSAEYLYLEDSGYAFIRSPQPAKLNERAQSSYLAFQGGFHSRAHKHADDLTFTWFDLGVEILVDAGRFGYIDLLPMDSPDRDRGFYYSAPERQYVESTLSHNTVMVGGRDIERRKRKPYGNAILDVQKIDDSFIILGQVDHDDYVHKRSILFNPSQRLTVTDDVLIREGEKDFVSWFNIDGSHEIVVGDDEQLVIKLVGGSHEIEVLSTGSLVKPVRGQKDPLRGWRSRYDLSLEPVWNFGFSGGSNRRRTMQTTFKVIAKRA